MAITFAIVRYLFIIHCEKYFIIWGHYMFIDAFIISLNSKDQFRLHGVEFVVVVCKDAPTVNERHLLSIIHCHRKPGNYTNSILCWFLPKLLKSAASCYVTVLSIGFILNFCFLPQVQSRVLSLLFMKTFVNLWTSSCKPEGREPQKGQRNVLPSANNRLHMCVGILQSRKTMVSCSVWRTWNSV